MHENRLEALTSNVLMKWLTVPVHCILKNKQKGDFDYLTALRR